MRGTGNGVRLGRLKVLAGLVSVLAVAGLIQSCTTRDVVAVVVGSVSVDPSSATVVAGDSTRFTARVLADDGTVLSSALVTWSSDNPSVLSIDANGMAHGLAAGAASVRASFRGASGSAAVTVAAGPSIVVDPTSVTFSGAVADVSPAAQVVQVTNGGGGTLGGLLASVQFQSGQASGWLDAALQSSSAPTSITLTPTVGLLPAGTYNATVVLSAQGAGNSPVSIPVTLTLTQDRPVIHLSPSSVSLQGEAGGSPATTSVQVTNAGGGSLTSMSSSVWYETAGGTWLSAALSGTSAPATLTITADPSGLAAGTYRGEIRVASPVAVTSPIALPVTLVVGKAADLTLSKSAPASALQGDAVTYTIQVYNAGPEAADSVLVMDTLPAGVSFVSTTGGTVSNGVLQWSMGSLAARSTAALNLVVNVGAGTTGVVTNRASVSSPTPDPDPSNNSASASTAIGTLFVADLSVTKTGPAAALGGDRVTYDITVSNAGPNEAQGVSVVDTLPTGTSFVSSTAGTESGGVLTWNVGSVAAAATPSVSVVVDIDPATRGTVTNRAWVHGTSVDPAPANDSSSVSMDVGAPPGFAISESAGATVVSENLTTDTFTLVLTAQPASNVVFNVTSSDIGEATVSPATLTFTSGNWNVPQSVVVTGVDDAIVDGNQVSTVTVSVDDASSDDAYDPLPDQYVSVTTQDNDAPGLTLSPKSLSVNESGTTATFSVVLNTQPTASVVLTVNSGDLTEASVSPATLTFSHGNWNSAQTVTVTGVDDYVDDGNQVTPVAVAVDVANSDGTYASVPPDTVSVTTVDNDAAGFNITDVNSPTVTEGGSTYQFTVKLTAQPLTDVVLSVSSSDTGEATVSPAQLTFTSGNWSTAQTVTVTGVDDAVVDGPQVSTITVSVVDASSDDAFDPVADQTRLVTTTDNETAGFTVTGGPLTVSETGTSQTFTVALTAQPVSNVVFDVSSSDTGEATVSPATLTFTNGNWNTAQTVTVTGVDDSVVDGPQNSTVTVSVNDAASQDQFDPLADKTVSVTTTDNETAGFNVTGGPLTVSESGTTATFQVVLTGQPVSNVVFNVTSSDTGEATASPATLTFTNGNWNAPQTVTVTGVADGIVDGNQTSTITVSVNDASSQDQFDPLPDQTVSVTTLDANAAGFAVTGGPLTVSESGTTGTFTVVLTAQPSSNVVFNISSSDTGEATAAPATLTFTPSSWSTAQTVTVTGVDDAIIDGPQTSTITVSVDDANSDNLYDPLPDQTVSVTTTDNDAAGFTVSGGPLTVSESGTSQTFTVFLTSSPAAATNVVFNLTSSDLTEATVSPATLTFTTGNWSTPQTVTVTGVDDAIIDGNQTSTITVSVNDASSDPAYGSVPDQTVSVTTTDNDAAGFTLTGGPLTVNESGTSQTFTVVLTSQPANNVLFNLTSSDLTEATVAPSTLTFTSGNWNVAQTVTVTGVDDLLQDGNQVSTITVSVDAGSDAQYTGLPDQTVSVTTVDNDVAGFNLSATSLSVNESGTTATFDVVLNAQPASGVVLSVTSGDLTEATVDKATLTFTSSNWNVAQTVTVTGVDDFVADGNQITAVTISVIDGSSDVAYQSVPDQIVNVTTVDNDAAGFTLTDLGSATVSETGSTYKFDVKLTSQPLSDVVLSVTSGDTGEATVSPATLTFTSANWNANQTVTVTGVDDTLVDGNQLTTITVSVVDALSDDAFDPLADQTRSVTTTDNEVAGFTVTGGPLTVSETGTTGTFTVVLTGQPETNVVFDVSSNDTGEATVSPATLTFTNGNWSTPQTVTVTGVADGVVDGNQTSTVTVSVNAAASEDPFDPLPNQTVSVTTTDVDVAGYTVTGGPLTVSESGTTGTFTVVLTAQPTSNVVFNVTSSDTGESTPSPSTLTFTNGDWSTPQTVTVTGVDDHLIDGPQNSTVTVSVNDAASQDQFDLLADQTVAVTTTDDDTAGFDLSTTALTVAEGATNTFTVVLTAQPVSNVVFNVSSNDGTASTVSPATLTFTNGNWDTPQTVTVTGFADHIIDGDQSSIVTVSVDASSDTNFTGMADQSVSVTTTNVDVAGFTLSTGSLTVAEGATNSFTVVLDAEPASNVVFNVSSDDATASTVSPATLTFTSGNWNNPQTVTVTGVVDHIIDPDQSSTVTVAVDGTSDPDFTGLADQTVAVTTTNVDAAGVTLSTNSLTVAEGATTSFTAVLDAEPASDVILDVSSNDATASTVDQATLTFTSSTWNNPQTVTVTGVADGVVDPDQSSTVTVAVAPSSDGDFKKLADQTVAVTTTNVDVAGFSLSTPTLSVDEGSTQDFTVVLTGRPATDVVLNVSSDDTNKSTVSTATLTFTNADWDTPQSVTVTGATVTQNETSHVTVSVDGSSDPEFTGLSAQQVTVTTVNVADDELQLVELSPSVTTTDIDGPTLSFANWTRDTTAPNDHRLMFPSAGPPVGEASADASPSVRTALR